MAHTGNERVMNIIGRSVLAALMAVGSLVAISVAHAQDDAAGRDIAQANNPLASATAFNIHNYYL